MFVVDTNVPVFAADERSLAHPVCVQRLEEWRGGSGAWLRERFIEIPLAELIGRTRMIPPSHKFLLRKIHKTQP